LPDLRLAAGVLRLELSVLPTQCDQLSCFVLELAVEVLQVLSEPAHTKLILAHLLFQLLGVAELGIGFLKLTLVPDDFRPPVLGLS